MSILQHMNKSDDTIFLSKFLEKNCCNTKHDLNNLRCKICGSALKLNFTKEFDGYLAQLLQNQIQIQDEEVFQDLDPDLKNFLIDSAIEIQIDVILDLLHNYRNHNISEQMKKRGTEIRNYKNQISKNYVKSPFTSILEEYSDLIKGKSKNQRKKQHDDWNRKLLKCQSLLSSLSALSNLIATYPDDFGECRIILNILSKEKESLMMEDFQ